MHATLEQALFGYTNDQLKQFGALLPGSPEGKRKAQLVDHVLGGVTGRLEAIVRDLDRYQKAAIAHIVHDGWEVYDEKRFHAIHGRVPNWGERDRGWYSRSTPSALALFFHEGTIPQDLRSRLRELVEPVPRRRLRVHDAAPSVTVSWREYGSREKTSATFAPHVYQGEQIALLEVTAALSLAARGKLRSTAKTQMPTAATVRQVSEVLVAPEPLSTPEEWSDEVFEAHVDPEDREVGALRAHALAWMLLNTKLVGQGGLARAGKALLAGPAHEAVKELWVRWCAQDGRDELELVRTIKGFAKARRWLTRPSSRRALLSDALRDVEVGVWFEVDDWIAQLRAEQRLPDVATDDIRSWELYVDHKEYGSLGYDDQHDAVLVPAYVRAFLFACAGTLGLVDLAYVSPDKTHTSEYWWAESVPFLSPFEGLHAVRLTPLGAWILGASDHYTPEVAAVDLRVLPNRDVVVLGGGDPGVTGLLDVYASSSAQNTWHLERDALLCAVEEGHDLDRLRAFLTEHNAEPLPSAVAALLDDVARRAAIVSPGEDAALFEVADPVVAAEIAHDRRTADLCRLLGDRTLVVARKDTERFKAALRGLGYSAGV